MQGPLPSMNIDNKFAIYNTAEEGFLSYSIDELKWVWDSQLHPIVLGVIRDIRNCFYRKLPADFAALADDLSKLIKKAKGYDLMVYHVFVTERRTDANVPLVYNHYELDFDEMTTLREFDVDDWSITPVGN